MNHSEFGHYRRDLRFSLTVVHVHAAVTSEYGRVRRRAQWAGGGSSGGAVWPGAWEPGAWEPGAWEPGAWGPRAGDGRGLPGGGGAARPRGAARRLGRVLVVGDDAEVRRLIAASLTLEGFDVAMAVDGQDCLDKVLAVAPDVITLDALMPRLDGYQTAVRLRRRPDTAHIKVVLTTPIPPQERAPERAAESGIDAYLVKPFDPAEMIRVVRSLAGHHRS